MGLLQDRRRARRWYRAVAPGYDAAVGDTFWPPAIQRTAVDRLGLDGGERVLDVGCGTGRTTFRLADSGATVVGLDHSSPQLARARRRSRLDGVGEVGFVRGDAEALPFPDDTFDAVCSVGAILFFPEPVAAMAAARRVTRPGGRLVVAGFNDPEGPPRTPVDAWARLSIGALFEHHDTDGARRLFRRAGWVDVESTVTGPGWHPRLVLVTTAHNPA